MPIKIRHHEQPAGTQHAPDFGKGILRVGQVVQHHIDAGEIRLAVPQRKVAEFPDAQRDALGFPFHPGKPPPGKLQHPRRAVHPDDLPGAPAHPFQHDPCPAPQIHRGIAAFGHRVAHGPGEVEPAEHFAAQGIPMFGDGIEELPRLERPVLDDPGGHFHIRAHFGVFVQKGHGGFQKSGALPFLHRRVKHPQPVPARGKQPRFGQDLEVARNPRLAHFEDAYQFIDGKFIPFKNIGKPQPGFVGQCLEIADSVGHAVSKGYRCIKMNGWFYIKKSSYSQGEGKNWGGHATGVRSGGRLWEQRAR